MLDTLRQVLSSPEFVAALPAAGVILGVGTGLVVVRRRLPALPVAGLFFAGGAVFGLVDTPVISDPFLWALAAFAVAGLVCEVVTVPSYGRVLLALPGAWLVSQALAFDEPAWVVPAVVAFLAFGAPLLASFDRAQLRPPLGPLVVAISVGAAYLVLPDTEEVLALLPLAAAVGLCGWPLLTLRLGGAGSHAALVVVVGVAAWDGRGRPAAIIGALATFTVPLVWAVLVGTPWARPVTATGRVVTLVALHLVVAIVAARVVGIGSSVSTATLLAALTLGLTIAVLAVFGRAGTAER